MQHDVAIIGGGPAACAAALTLRLLDLSVCVMAAPGQKDHPTETAVPALPGLLHSLGASEALAACEPCYGILSGWGRHSPVLKPAIADPNGHAWFIHRARFDASLKNAALKRGVEWINAEAQTMIGGEDGVTITTPAHRLHARWVVIATGSPSSAARLTGQKATRFDSMIAFWAHLPAPYEQRLLIVEPFEQGWWYLCPAEGPGATACLMTDPASARRLGPSQLAAWSQLFRATSLSRQLQGKPLAEQVHVVLTGLAALPEKHGLRWIAVGDAAAKLDPLGSSGTATALDSGQRAARAVADALQGNSAALNLYGRWTTGLVEEFARQRRQQYAYEARRQENPFWSRRIFIAA